MFKKIIYSTILILSFCLIFMNVWYEMADMRIQLNRQERYNNNLTTMFVEKSETIQSLTERVEELENDRKDLVKLVSDLKSGHSVHPEVLIKIYCEQYGVDYKLATAISKLETGNWESEIFRELCNFGGIKKSSGKWQSYSSYAAGAEAFVKLLKVEYIDKGLKTPEAMSVKYATTKTWGTKVREIMKEL